MEHIKRRDFQLRRKDQGITKHTPRFSRGLFVIQKKKQEDHRGECKWSISNGAIFKQE